MPFANPQFLWALPLASLPVLLHLFFRRRKSRVDFSTLRFFQSRKRFLSHRRRIREWVLLTLRTLSLLALILGLSRPLFQNLPFSGGGRTDIVIILDDSLSMQRSILDGRTAFDLAKQKAVEAIDTLKSGDGCALIFTSGKPAMPLTRALATVNRAIETAPVTGAAGSFAAASHAADDMLLQSGAPNQEVFVFSDFQKSQIPSEKIKMRNSRARIYFMKTGHDSANLSVGRIAVSSKPKITGHPFLLSCAVKNHGDVEKGTTIRLFVEGKEEMNTYITIPPGTSVAHHFTYVPRGAGVLSGSIRIDDQSVHKDNEAFFALSIVDTIHVLLLETDVLSRVDDFTYFERAVCPPGNPDLNGVRINRAFVQELTPQSFTHVHLAVLANPSLLPPPQAKEIGEFVKKGGALLCFSGSRVTPNTLVPIGLPALDNVFKLKCESSDNGLRFSGPLRPLNDLLQMNLLNWRRRTPLALDASWDTWASLHNAPIIAQHPFRSGAVILTAFSTRRDYSNWPVLKSFPITMLFLLNAAVHDTPPATSIVCGQAVGTVSDGTGGATRVIWQPGIIRDQTTQGGRVLVANPAPAESDLHSVSVETASQALVNRPVSQLDTADFLAAQVEKFRRGSDLSGLFLLLAGLCLLVESGLAYRYKPAGRQP